MMSAATTARPWPAAPSGRRRGWRILPTLRALAVDLAVFSTTFTVTVVVGRLLEIGV